MFDRIYDPNRDEEDAERQADYLKRLRSAMDELNESDRAIVTARLIDSLSNREAADQLGLTDQAASMRYVRAVRRLRKLMEGPGDDA